MTRDELIELSTEELGRLPQDELAVVQAHFKTDDRAELVRLLAEEAEEMWSEMDEAPVPPAEWPSAHLEMILGMHRDEQREALFAERRGIALEIIDALEPIRRALLCWRLHTTNRRWIAARMASAVTRAIDEELVKVPTFREAAVQVIDFEIDLQIDEIDDHYHHGPQERGDGRGEHGQDDEKEH